MVGKANQERRQALVAMRAGAEPAWGQGGSSPPPTPRTPLEAKRKDEERGLKPPYPKNSIGGKKEGRGGDKGKEEKDVGGRTRRREEKGGKRRGRKRKEPSCAKGWCQDDLMKLDAGEVRRSLLKLPEALLEAS